VERNSSHFLVECLQPMSSVHDVSGVMALH